MISTVELAFRQISTGHSEVPEVTCFAQQTTSDILFGCAKVCEDVQWK